MRFLIIFLLMMTIGYAKKTDIYFGNGIMTDSDSAQAGAKTLSVKIREDIFNDSLNQFNEYVNNVDYAFNSTHGLHDLFPESVMQKLSLTTLLDKLKASVHSVDLTDQITKYLTSMGSNNVIIVAHSQGNFFAKEAYDELKNKLGDDLDKQLYIIRVASPALGEIQNGSPRVDWDSDMVSKLSLDIFRDDIECDVRRVAWDLKEIDSSYSPKEIYLYESNIGKSMGAWKSRKSLTEDIDFNVHAFRFYMGKPLKGLFSNYTYKDPFEKRTLIDNQAKVEILGYIKRQLDINIGSGGDNNTDTENNGRVK